MPDAEDSHPRILRQPVLDIPAVRPGITTASNRDTLDELREFRHLFRHGYGVALRPERLQELAALAVSSWPAVKERLDAFVVFVDECVSNS